MNELKNLINLKFVHKKNYNWIYWNKVIKIGYL